MANTSDTCETVTITTKNGPVDINKADFDPAVHKLASAPKAAARKGASKG